MLFGTGDSIRTRESAGVCCWRLEHVYLRPNLNGRGLKTCVNFDLNGSVSLEELPTIVEFVLNRSSREVRCLDESCRSTTRATQTPRGRSDCSCLAVVGRSWRVP